MEKITVKELVEFSRRSDKAKKSFAHRLKTRKPVEKKDTDLSEGGGDYWVISNSCLYNVIKDGQIELLLEKIEEVKIKLSGADDSRIQTMYSRNIEILNSFSDINPDDLKPSEKLQFQKVPKQDKVIRIDGLPIYINPTMIFSYEKNGKDFVGGIWLVPQLYGFRNYEIGMFCESLHQFLLKNFSDKFQIDSDYCIAIDTYNAETVTHTELANKSVPKLLDKTLKELNEL